MDKPIDNLRQGQLDSRDCPVCRDLLTNLGRFFEMIEGARKAPADHWLTVEEIANELKISKSIVYRLIRNGDLESVNLVETNGHIAQKGHYRVKRQCLDQFLEQKKVKPPPQKSSRPYQSRSLPKVKNHLGL